MATTIAVLGDVHVTTAGTVPAAFTSVVRAVAALRPRCVVLCGDATSGNPSDGYSLPQVRTWWHAYQEALAPLRAAGTPILVIAGNHDYYTKAHADGYREAWADLRTWAAPLSLAGAPPLSYSCSVDGFHLSLAHVIDQEIQDDVARWLAADLAGAAAAKARICFGHVPLISAMGQTSTYFRGHLGGLLAQGRATLYLSGHEHLVWDEPLDVPGGKVRQVIVGTPGASYTYPLRRDLIDRTCAGARGTLPGSGVVFALDPATGYQTQQVAFVLLECGDDGTVRVRPMALDKDGSAMDFDEGVVTRWLQGALGHLLGTSVPATGAYDDATRHAVLALQQREGLAADGIAGPLTRHRVRALLGDA
jgi:peptidoglycan hydrolase-like protein with peptidoglycan-binding domain